MRASHRIVDRSQLMVARKRMTIEFDADADPVQGAIVDEAGTGRVEFSGYLGLVSAIAARLEPVAEAAPGMPEETRDAAA
jgi:hypothetical protein